MSFIHIVLNFFKPRFVMNYYIKLNFLDKIKIGSPYIIQMEKLYNGGFYPAMNFQKCVHLTENYTILYRYYIYYCHWTYAVVYQKMSMDIFGALLTMSLIQLVMDSECKEGAKYVSLSMIWKEKRCILVVNGAWIWPRTD